MPTPRLSIDLLIKEAHEVKALGIPAVILFGIPDQKDERVAQASIRTASSNARFGPGNRCLISW